MKYLKYFESKKIELEILSEESEFFYIDKMKDNMSGWKIHIFGNSIEDSIEIFTSLKDIIKDYNLCMKVASKSGIQKWIGKVGNKDYGKCATIYLPASVFVNYNHYQIIKKLVIKYLVIRKSIVRYFIDMNYLSQLIQQLVLMMMSIKNYIKEIEDIIILKGIQIHLKIMFFGKES